MEDHAKLERLTPMEHVDQLNTIGRQSQDKQKQFYQKKKQPKHPDIEKTLDDEEILRQQPGDGHIDYHA